MIASLIAPSVIGFANACSLQRQIKGTSLLVVWIRLSVACDQRVVAHSGLFKGAAALACENSHRAVLLPHWRAGIGKPITGIAMTQEPKPSLFDYCDVCISRTSSPEWVGVLASEKGQHAVQALFPIFPIAWPPMPELALGWSGTELDLRKIMELCPGHN
jgi:hypothetical protein